MGDEIRVAEASMLDVAVAARTSQTGDLTRNLR